MIDILLKYGINPNVQDSNGWSALHIVARDNDYELAEYLIKKYKLDKSIINKNKDYPLHIASQFGNQDIIQLLLNDNINIDTSLNATNDSGWTPYHLACQYNKKEVFVYFCNLKSYIINNQTIKE
eukprot:jgi/Orpsp1_1/1178106/evm.model.c7180000064062.1